MRACRRERQVATTSGWRSRATAIIALSIGFTWLLSPIIDSYAAASRRQVDAEAPWILAAAMALVVLLAQAIWTDTGRSTRVIGVLGSLVVVDIMVRAWITPKMMGIEPVYVLPMLAGMAFGLPCGVLVGAASCVVSSVAINSVSSALPGQMLIWAGVGALGAILVRVRTIFAWLWGVVLGFVAGPLAGLFLNLTGWPTDNTAGDTSFFVGLPPQQNLLRLVRYTVQTSLAYDSMRGLTTAVGVLLVGLPLLVALRRVWGVHPRFAPAGLVDVSADAVSPASLARREHSARLSEMWAAPPSHDEDQRPAGTTEWHTHIPTAERQT